MHTKLIKSKRPLSVHAVWIVIILALAAITRFVPPMICPFHKVTGVPCLTCGATRAADALLTGDIWLSFTMNPLLVIFAAGLSFFSLFKIAEYIFRVKIRLEPGFRYTRSARIFLLAVIAANWLFLILDGR